MTEENKSAPTGDMRVLIEQIAKALVDDPAQVSVNPVEEGGETVLELTVAPNDLGRLKRRDDAAKLQPNCTATSRTGFTRVCGCGPSPVTDRGASWKLKSFGRTRVIWF